MLTCPGRAGGHRWSFGVVGHVHMWTWLYMAVYTCTCTCTRAYGHVHVYMAVYVHVHVHVHVHMAIYMPWDGGLTPFEGLATPSKWQNPILYVLKVVILDP